MESILYYREKELVGLRSLKRDDLENYRDILDDQKVTEFLEMGEQPTTDKILEKTYFEANQSPDSIVFAVEIKKTKSFIGTAGLYLFNWVARRAQFRILLKNYNDSNKGIGTETTKLIVEYGFKRLNLELIYLGVNEKNTQAIRVYEKSGFINEGVSRKFIFNNGIFYNQVNMSITKEDFLNSKNLY